MTAKALAPIMIHLRSLGDGLGISRKRVVTFEDIQFAGAEFPRDVVDAIDILVGVGHAMPRREHDIGSDERARADRLVVWALVKHHHDGVIRRAGVERSVDDGVEPLLGDFGKRLARGLTAAQGEDEKSTDTWGERMEWAHVQTLLRDCGIDHEETIFLGCLHSYNQ